MAILTIINVCVGVVLGAVCSSRVLGGVASTAIGLERSGSGWRGVRQGWI